MPQINASPGNLPITCTVGNDLVVTLSVTENGSAYVWGTPSSTIYDAQGRTAQATDFTIATPSNGVATLTLTDANTTALGEGTFRYEFSETKSGLTRTWLAGTLSITNATQPGTSSYSATVTLEDVTISLSLVSASGAQPLTGGVRAIPPQPPTRTGDVTLTAGAAYGTTYPVDVPIRVRRARLRVSGQTGTCDVGVYDTSYDRLVSSGSVQVAAAGPQEIALPPTEIPAGFAQVWVSVSGTAGMAASATQGDLAGSEMVTSGANPLPATITDAFRTANFVAVQVLPDDPLTEFSTAYARTATNYSVVGKIGTRLYARNTTNDKFAYSDDSGDNWSDSSTTMTSVFGAAACLEIIGYTTYMFAVLDDGRIMRANLDAFSTWADKSVSDAPSGTTGRVGVLATDASTRLFYTNYNSDAGTPGVYVWRSGSAGDTWSKSTLAAGARHGHAVAVDATTSTTIWCTVGDSAPDRGLYKSTDNGVNWTQVSSNRYGIDIGFAYSLAGGVNRVILEGDGNAGAPHMMSYLSALSTALTDPVVWPDTDPEDNGGSWAGTGRAMKVTSEGNLFYATTGEAGAVGGREGLWIAKGPWFTTPVLLEEWDQGDQPSWRRTYESGNYLFNGVHRITRPVFSGQ